MALKLMGVGVLRIGAVVDYRVCELPVSSQFLCNKRFRLMKQGSAVLVLLGLDRQYIDVGKDGLCDWGDSLVILTPRRNSVSPRS